MTVRSGVGLDVGTMWIVSARKTPDAIDIKKIRDIFIDVKSTASAKKLLKLSNVDFIERDGNLFVVGEEALDYANMFMREARRPLSEGIISAKEVDALEILYKLLESVLGKPSVPDELCVYSVPGKPIDSDRDIIYHTEIFSRMIAQQGFVPKALNEAHAIIFFEGKNYRYSGLAFSWGAGMVNVSLVWRSLPVLSFSISRGGDWIDRLSGSSLGRTAAEMCVIKEKSGFNLMNYKTREEEALAIHYKSLMKYAIETIVEEFKRLKGGVNINEPIPILLSGGTSLVAGFVDLFKIAFEEVKNFPLPIKEIIHVQDPLGSVAKGLMIAALMDSGE